jgi:hypothetical protein
MSEKNRLDWLRREKWHLNFKDFSKSLEKSKEECPDLSQVNELLFIVGWVFASFLKIPSFFINHEVSKEYSQKLTFTCLIDLMHSTNCTTFMIGCGLYKNAYHNLRYALESIVHCLYMDLRHPDADFRTKIAILNEGENLPEYHGVHLLKALEISNKEEIMREYDRINKEYRKLSRNVHFTYRQLLGTRKNITELHVSSTVTDCNEVSKIYSSMKIVYDFFLFLFLSYFPDLKEPLAKNEEFVDAIKDHNLKLVCKILNV